jgi:hypothetical protein
LVVGAIALVEKAAAKIDGRVVHDERALLGKEAFVAAVWRDKAFRHV